MDKLNPLIASHLGRFAAGTCGFLDYCGTERLPENHGVLLVKHQSLLDIVAIGAMLHAAQGRYAHYLMKASLPSILEYVGGICLARAKEARKDPEAARAMNDAAFAQVETHLRDDGLIVAYPEGHRYWKKVGAVKCEGIERIVRMQSRGFRIPFIPVGLRYGRTSVRITVGQRRHYDAFGADEARELEGILGTLSGLAA